MFTGKLTPRSNSLIKEARFSGNFGQPDGFGSILTVRIAESGHVALTLDYRKEGAAPFSRWSVDINNEQRIKLIEILSCHQPILHEIIEEPKL